MEHACHIMVSGLLDLIMRNYLPTGKQTVTFWTESDRDMIYSMLLTEGFKFNYDNDELIDIITKK